MVVTVCPTTLNVDETLFALQFATRARNVSLGPAHKNVGAKNLLEEGKDLRAKLREAGRKKVLRMYLRRCGRVAGRKVLRVYLHRYGRVTDRKKVSN